MLSSSSGLWGLSTRELAACAVAFALTLPAVTPRIYASDEIQYFSYLRSLWFDGDVSFENEYRYFHDRNIGGGEGFKDTFLELRTDTGLRPNFGTMGAAVLWAPFYLAGDVAARASGGPADGFSPPYVAAVAYGSAFYGFLAVLLGVSAARRLRRSGAPQYAELLAGFVVWCGTPLLFYMYVAPPYAHAVSAFAVALFVWVWLHVRREWSVRGAVALGLSAALMAMVREQDAFLALGPAIDFLLAGRGRLVDPQTRPEYAKAAAAGVLAFIIGYAPQLLAYSALNGYPRPSRLVTRKMLWSSPHALQVLFSPEHGFLLWTPLAAIAIAGLIVLAVRGDAATRRVGACALAMVAAAIYVSGSVDSWTVAGAFGQRRFVAISALLIIGLATIFSSLSGRAPQLAAGAAIAFCIWWNVALMAAFGTGLMDRQRLELKRNAYVAFVTIPRMAPELAARYLTRRDSFYQQSQRQP